MRTLRTNRGEIAQEGKLKIVMLYASDSKNALILAQAFMDSGYTVRIGPMNTLYKGVRVTVWFKEGLWT